MESIGFNIYDEKWRECWVAATSNARCKHRRRGDFNIAEQVARLLHEHGPGTESPLTLRIYSTMIKGFCVVNNERVKLVQADCERVIHMFTKKPFCKGDQALQPLPAKCRRGEAALTLDLDVRRVEEAEGFDWAQAALEPGVMLDGGGGHLLPDLPATMELPGFAVDPLIAFGALESGVHAAGLPAMPPQQEAAVDAGAWQPAAVDPGLREDELLLSQIVASETAVPHQSVDMAGFSMQAQTEAVPAEALPSLATEKLAVMGSSKKRRFSEALLPPGVVYGFDNATLLDAGELEGSTERFNISRPALSAKDNAAEMLSTIAGPLVDHVGLNMRRLLESQ
eukprot:4775378-Amphidinium_carterae.1